MTSHYTSGPMATLHDFGSVLGRPLDTFGLSQFRGHGSWLPCEVALSTCLVWVGMVGLNVTNRDTKSQVLPA